MQQRHMRLDTTVLVWGHKLHEQDAGALLVTMRQGEKGRIAKTHIGVSRGSQTLCARDDYLKSPHWACRRHPHRTGWSYIWSDKTDAIFTVGVVRVLSGHTRIKGGFQPLLLGCRVYTARGFISHHVGEPNDAGGQPTRVYQMRQ